MTLSSEREDGAQNSPADELEAPGPLFGQLGLPAALEAILFSSSRPLKLRELQQATDASRVGVEHALEELREALGGRGLMLQRLGDQVQLATRPEVAAFVRRALHPEVAGRLSPAAYETLAIVAYQQPVTRARVEETRGVNCESVLNNLELRALVTEVGRGNGPGQPKLYGTTMRFLQLIGVGSLEDLPMMEPLSSEAAAEGGDETSSNSIPLAGGEAEEVPRSPTRD